MRGITNFFILILLIVNFSCSRQEKEEKRSPSGIENDEKHVHPLQLDVINRIIVLRTNPGEIVFTPFMGVGSEVYGSVYNNRKGIGVELKKSYYNQAIKNLAEIEKYHDEDNLLFEVG